MKTILVRLYLKNGTTKEYRSSRAINRILSGIRRVQFKKAYVRVGYGKKIDSSGKLSEFHNDGSYFNVDDALDGVSTFWSED